MNLDVTITDAKRVVVKPGDVIVLKAHGPVTKAWAADIKEQAKAIWPDNEVVVLNQLDIEVHELPDQPSAEDGGKPAEGKVS